MPDSIVGFISGSSVKIWFMHSIFNLFKGDKDQRFGADFILVYGPYIHQNRNTLVQNFLETDREWLFMVDNDMVFEPKDVWTIFEKADTMGPGIYGGAYILESGVLVCGPWAKSVPLAYHTMNGLPENDFQVGVTGAGFTLIHREVFNKIGKDWFTALGPLVGEDVSFCHRANEIGYNPWIIPASNPGHHKELVLYPHSEVRNLAGIDVNLVNATSEIGEKVPEMV